MTADQAPPTTPAEGLSTSPPPVARDGSAPGVLARTGLSDRRWSDRSFQPGEAERAALVAGFGAELRAARLGAGLSMRQLSARAGMCKSSISQLECGLRRPRRSMLRSLADGIMREAPDVGYAERLEARLIEAAGPSIREDTAASVAMRRRRRRRAGLRMYRVAQKATALDRESMAMFNESCNAMDPAIIAASVAPGASAAAVEREAAMLTRVERMLDASRALREQSERMREGLDRLKPPRARGR